MQNDEWYQERIRALERENNYLRISAQMAKVIARATPPPSDGYEKIFQILDQGTAESEKAQHAFMEELASSFSHIPIVKEVYVRWNVNDYTVFAYVDGNIARLEDNAYSAIYETELQWLRKLPDHRFDFHVSQYQGDANHEEQVFWKRRD